jgi:hypothetical protein
MICARYITLQRVAISRPSGKENRFNCFEAR